ncbi:MAG: glycosyltransferase family 1 protein [Desulfobacteraceae bacterium]|nr:MAG: glycosyltransferase family 1 protein [Desulfobacteraceae bacterium]
MNVTERVRILHFTSSRGFYGAERVILSLLENTDPVKYDASLASFVDSRDPHLELLEEAARLNMPIYPVHCSGRLDPGIIRQLIRILRTNSIDILHCHEQKSRFYGLFAARISGIPAVTTGHSWNRANLLQTAYEYIDALMLRFFDRVVPVSRKLECMMRRFGIPNHLLEVVPNGVDPAKFRARSSDVTGLRNDLGILPTERVVGNAGRLIELKGQKYLLEAARQIVRKHPEVKFIIVGDGPLKQVLSRQAASCGIEDHVVFTGFRNDMPNIYAAIDVFTLPSLDEASPMTIFEAAAAGLPIVATKVGGIGDVITNGQNGLLIEPHDVKGLCDAILYLLENESESDRMGKTAAATAQREHSIGRMVRRYEAIYEKILARDTDRAPSPVGSDLS